MNFRWHRLEAGSLPPERETFLLWLGLDDSDGGFPAVAELFRDRDGTPYIMFHGAKDVWKIFFECEWRGMMWAEIPIPDLARRKREREQRIRKRNGVE